MDAEFTRRVRSAAVAGWWTLLIGAVFLAITWGAYLAVMCTKPAWMLGYWGGAGMNWEMMQVVWVWMTAIFKLVLWVAAIIVVWLTLWARRLARA